MGGYSGDGTVSCDDVDECKKKTHKCHEDALCENTVGSFNCRYSKWIKKATLRVPGRLSNLIHRDIDNPTGRQTNGPADV